MSSVGRTAVAPPAIGSPSLRGRDTALAVARARVLPPREGGVLVVEAPPGFGRSRFVDEVVATAAGAGVRVGASTALPGDDGGDMAMLLAAVFDGPTPLADRDLLARLPARPEQRYWLVQALGSLLADAARTTPVLVCLDDLHRADPVTLAALRVLPGRLERLPIGWLVTAASGPVKPPVASTVDRLHRLGGPSLALRPLAGSDVTALVADIVGAEPAAPLLRTVGGAGGNPRLVVDLVVGLVEECLVRVAGGRAQLVGHRLPRRVRERVRAALAEVSVPARSAAGVAALLGATFSFDLLTVVLGRRPVAVLEQVDELVEAGVLTAAGDELAFRYDLERRVVADGVPPVARWRLQRAVAEALLAGRASPADAAPLEFTPPREGDHNRGSVTPLRPAGATHALAPDPVTEAETERAAVAPHTSAWRSPDDPRRSALAARTALLLHAVDRPGDGVAVARRALARPLPPDQKADVLLGVAGMASLPPDERADANRRALALVGTSPGRRRRHLAELAANLADAGRAADAAEVVADIATSAEVGGEPGADLALDLARSRLDGMDGAYGTGIARLDRVLGNGDGLADRALLDSAAMWRSELLAVTDRLDDAVRAAAAGAAQARSDGRAWAARVWGGIHGQHLLRAGRLTDAARELRAAGVADAARRHASPPGTVVDAAAVVAFGRVALHTVDYEAARACTRTAATMGGARAPEVCRLAAWLLALVAMATGEPVTALHNLAGDDGGGRGAGRGPGDGPRLPADPADAPQLMRLALATGDRRLAHRVLDDAAHRRLLNPGQVSIEAAATHTRGLWLRDDEELGRAAASLAAGPRPLAYASALEDLGRERVRRDDRDAGVDALGSALEVYAGAGAAWDAGRVRRRLRALGVRRRLVRPAVRATGWAGLTAAEEGVVRLVAQGLTNRAVAARLFLSPHTVSMHLRHVFAKLGISSRVELTRIVLTRDGAVG